MNPVTLPLVPAGVRPQALVNSGLQVAGRVLVWVLPGGSSRCSPGQLGKLQPRPGGRWPERGPGLSLACCGLPGNVLRLLFLSILIRKVRALGHWAQVHPRQALGRVCPLKAICIPVPGTPACGPGPTKHCWLLSRNLSTVKS